MSDLPQYHPYLDDVPEGLRAQMLFRCLKYNLEQGGIDLFEYLGFDKKLLQDFFNADENTPDPREIEDSFIIFIQDLLYGVKYKERFKDTEREESIKKTNA